MAGRTVFGQRCTAYAALVGGLCFAFGAAPASAAQLKLGPTTLRDCTSRQSADPINVAFVGPRATAANTQRLVGYDRSGSDLKWRTTSSPYAGGRQYIVDSSDGQCSFQDGQSSNGVLDKHHTRYFQQLDPFIASGGTDFLFTGLDAHREVKSPHCKGAGDVAGVNDRVPVKHNGFTDGGYNQGQREFLKAFSDLKAPRHRSPAQGARFIQCPGDSPPRRYTVGWNGWLQYFNVYQTIPCQNPWHRFKVWLGSCPSGN